MEVCELHADSRDSTISLWQRAGLTRPWNAPGDDFDRALASDASTILGILLDGSVIGTAMVGHDGHRGWVYYLAVEEAHRQSGLGALMMDAAEDWVRRSGMPKIQLMVRSENAVARDFYLHRGYEASDVTVYGRWL